MTDLCDNMKLDRAYVEKMVNKWSVGTGTGFYVPPLKEYGKQDFESLQGSAWLRKVLKSTGFIPLDKKQDAPRSFSQYPTRMQNYIIDTILPIYFNLMGHSANIISSHPDKLKLIERLLSVNAVEAYVIAMHLKKMLPDSNELNEIIIALERGLDDKYSAILSKIKSLT
jgi:hypothetical protein